jgi:hypothetical protein
VDEIAGALHAFATGVLRGGLSAKGKMV